MANRFHGRARGLALLLTAASGLGALGWLWWCGARCSTINFLPRRAAAEWIVYPIAPDAGTYPQVEMLTRFDRSFVLESAPAQAVLSIAGFHRYAFEINGSAPAAPIQRGRNWKQPDSIDVSRQLRAGDNHIAVTVFNTNGPPALWLSLEAPGLSLGSDETWQASYAGAAPRAARLASEPRIIPAGSPLAGGAQPLASFQACWPMLLLFRSPLRRRLLAPGQPSTPRGPPGRARSPLRAVDPSSLLHPLSSLVAALPRCAGGCLARAAGPPSGNRAGRNVGRPVRQQLGPVLALARIRCQRSPPIHSLRSGT